MAGGIGVGAGVGAGAESVALGVAAAALISLSALAYGGVTSCISLGAGRPMVTAFGLILFLPFCLEPVSKL